MTKPKCERIVLPALRGVMGCWVYYSCLMNLKELAQRVRYAEEVHNNKHLSDMIQRQLTRGRSALIAAYLDSQEERFFNSLVVATYGGQPNWHALTDIKSKDSEEELSNLQDETIASVGFLTLQGDENLFALDGQHRLAGIKKAIKDGLDQDPFDEVSVIFVAHEKTKKGLERTRRLFTTLNKTARPVSKGDIIALDEDDVMAISVRRLIEQTKLFHGSKVAFVASNNMPASNTVAMTTIGNLYDVLTIVFTNAKTELKKTKADLQRSRPNDEALEAYFSLAKEYFECLGKYVPEAREFFSTENTEEIVKKYRGNHGGSAIYRPIGLEIFTRIVAKLTHDMTLNEAVKLAAKLPRTLSKAPYVNLMWDSSNKTISNSHNVTLREILLYMVGASKMTEATLTERYQRETGNDLAKLPAKII
ncbi:MAG: DNA sulfur modification protein DndB [Alphaproteobacteria bacterium]|nr:DNA sulfur modification protein DndB [Alphaproteobacteria bacterium]